jgi:hypothetical protein
MPEREVMGYLLDRVHEIVKSQYEANLEAAQRGRHLTELHSHH